MAVMAIFCPTRAFVSVDLPVLGEEYDDAVGFPQVVGADDQGAFPIGFPWH